MISGLNSLTINQDVADGLGKLALSIPNAREMLFELC